MKRNSPKSTTPKPKKDLTWKGKKYKSPLEVFTAQQLELAGLPNHYEELKVTLKDKFTCTSPSWEQKEVTNKVTRKKEKVWGPLSANIRAITCSFDWPCATTLEGLHGGWLMETKGIVTEGFSLRWKMFKEYLTSHGIEVTLYLPKSQKQVLWCIQDILTKQQTNNL